ncbi:unnamed protein product [Symbiodinium microadriaticum]|nr:unnamed protein product [Symbiodinium microadriaticum]
MQLRVSCVNRTDPVSSAPYSSTSLTKVGHVSTPAAIWADALKVAVDNTEYRLARAEGMARSALQPLLALLCAQSDVHLQKTSASAVSTRNFQPSCSAMDRWEEVFANTCAVSGLELLSAWEGLELSCMQHEDEMGRALQTEELREERARASCQVMMSLEDDRSSVLRTIDHLLARETALVAVLHKRDKVLSGDYSLDRWGGGGRHAKLTTTDKSCDGAYRDMYGRKNGSGNGFFAGVEELDGVLVRSPLWWSSESSGTDVLKDDRECDRYGKRRIGRKRKKSPPQAAGSEGDTRKRLRSVVGYPGSVYTQQSADSISKPLSPSVDRRLSDGHVMLNEEKVLKEILLRKKLINRINK